MIEFEVLKLLGPRRNRTPKILLFLSESPIGFKCINSLSVVMGKEGGWI